MNIHAIDSESDNTYIIPAVQMRLIYLIIVILYIGLVVYTAWNGPTITQDDYWYMNDVRTFVHTGRMQSNEIYPAMLADGSYKPPVVIHNLPLMYVAAPLVMLLGAFWGWVTVNILFNLLTCVLLSAIARRFKARQWQQITITAMFLLWPLTVHLSAHPIAESGILFFVTLLGYFWLSFRSGYVRQILLGILAAIVVLNRPSYLVMVLLIILLILADKDIVMLRRIGYVTAFILCFSLCRYAGNLLLPQIDLDATAQLKLPYGQAMLHFFSLKPIPFSLTGFILKLLTTIKLQLAGRLITHTVFVTFFNLLMFWFLLHKHVKGLLPGKDMHTLIRMYLLTYLGTIVVFQFQARFMQSLMPFLTVWFVLTVPHNWKKQLIYGAVCGFCLICLAGNLYIGRQNRKDAIQAKQIELAYEQIETHLQPAGAILVENNSSLLPYALNDIPALLMFDSKVNSLSELQWMRAKVPYQWLICQTASPALDSLRVMQPELVSVLPQPMTEWGLYKLK